VADPLELTTATEVRRRLGQDSVAAQYAPDATNPATYSAERMTDAIRDASTDICGYAQVGAELAGATNAERRERFPDLASLTARLARIYYVRHATGGQGIPDSYKEEQTQIVEMAREKAGRKASIGHPDTPPSASQCLVAEVNVDPNNNRMGSMTSWKGSGFC